MTISVLFELVGIISETEKIRFELVGVIAETAKPRFELVGITSETVKSRFELVGITESTTGALFELVGKQLYSSTPVLFELVGKQEYKNTTSSLFELVGLQQYPASGFDNDFDFPEITINGLVVGSWTDLQWGYNDGSILIEGSFNLISSVEALAVRNLDPVVVSFAGTDYRLLVRSIIPAETITDTTADLDWAVTVASPAILLLPGYADDVTKTWPAGIMIKAIVQELCDTDGITLDFQAPNEPIKKYVAEKSNPMAIVQDVCEVPGYLLESSAAGELVVRKEYQVEPKNIKTYTPSVIVPELRIISMAEIEQNPAPLYNEITVTDQGAGDDTGTITIETVDNGIGSKIIRAYHVPWSGRLECLSSTDTGVGIVNEGIKTELVEDELVEFKDGKSQTSKPIYGTLEIEWQEDNLGSFIWTESGEVETDGEEESLAYATYTKKWVEWTVFYVADKDIQFIIRDY